MEYFLHYIDMVQRDEKIWLVKSNGRILGPVSMDEIENLLKTKEIVVLDEVSSPCRRWQYIRDHEEFVDLVEEVRRFEFGINEDQTSTMSIMAQTASITEKMAPGAMDELTDTIGPQEIILDDLLEEPSSGKFQHHTQRPAQYSPYKNTATDKPTKWLWGLVLFLLVGSGTYVLIQKNRRSTPASKTTKELYNEGLAHYYSGDYSEAILPLRMANQLDPNNKQIQNLLIPLLVQYEPGKQLEVRRIISELLETESSQSKVRSLTTLGLLDSKTRNYSDARVNLLKAVEGDPFSWQAIANLGVVDFLQGNYLKAKNYFESAINVELNQKTARGEIYLMRAQSFVYLWKSEKEDNYLRQAKSLLKTYLAEFYDYRQEAHLILGYIYFLEGNKNSANREILNMLNTDPLLTREHAKDPLVNRAPIAWQQLLTWCRDLAEWVGRTPNSLALEGLCYIQSGREVESKEKIAEAVKILPRDPLILSIFAYIEWVTGNESKAELMASNAVDLNSTGQTYLPHVVKARICENIGNYSCAIDEWKIVQSIEPKSVSALGGLAYSYLKSKKFRQFEAAFFEAAKRSKYYKPLLRSQVLAEKEGIHVKEK